MLNVMLLVLAALQQLPAFRTEVRVVRVDVEARLEGRPIEDLLQHDFRISDNGDPQEILYFGHSEEPLDIILLFDTSGSMRPALEQVASVARVALEALRPDDRVAVMAFDVDTDVIADFTSDRAAIDATIRNVVLQRPPVGYTRLQGAVGDAARYFLSQPRSNRRRAVLVVTDNMGSSRDEGGTADLWQTDTVVSGVVVPGMEALRRQRRFFPPTWFGFGTIDGMVEKTGGDVLKGDAIADNFRQMIQRLRRRYTLHYAMPEAKAGAQRTIKVELTREAARRLPGSTLLARTGYVVPQR